MIFDTTGAASPQRLPPSSTTAAFAVEALAHLASSDGHGDVADFACQ
jgi:hypothetical protein